jgi:hypothetical protein
MDDFNHNKTLLGEKFNSTDFPLEPQAWGEMEKLLADQKPKPPLSIWANKTLFLMVLVLIGFMFLYVSQSPKNPLNSRKAANFSVENKVTIGTILPPKASNTPSVNTPLSWAFPLKNTTHSDIYNESLGDKAGILTQAISPSYAPTPPQYKADFDRFLTKNQSKIAVENNEKKGEKKGEKNETYKGEILEKQGENNKALFYEDKEIEKRHTVQNVENQQYTNLNLNETLKVTRDFVIPTKEESGYKYSQVPVLHSDSSFVGMIKFNAEKTDVENAFSPFDLLELNTVYSMTSDVYNPQNLLAKNVIPLSKLVKGPRYQLDIGFGSATYLAPKNINHFRLAFQYRLTPLFGLGVSSNYSMKLNEKGEKGTFFTSDLEGLLYFINKRKVDFVVSAGYGYRQWQIPSYVTELKKGKGKGFTLGLVTQYRFNERWVAGFRVDIKEISNTLQDPAYVLTFGKRF